MTKIVPVIHILNKEQVEFNIDLCHKNGIDFVFLIQHGGNNPVEHLIECFYFAKEKYPDMKIGINFLQLTTLEAFKKANLMKIKPDAIWSDVSHITPNDLSIANEIDNNRNGIKYFGSVAFKYQKQPTLIELQLICAIATQYIDVITTSGPSTGTPASEEKISIIKNYIGNHEMAIASGVNSENKEMFSKYVDYLLVASSITDYTTEIIIESKLKQLLTN